MKSVISWLFWRIMLFPEIASGAKCRQNAARPIKGKIGMVSAPSFWVHWSERGLNQVIRSRSAEDV